ncbi:MAG: hypothetical protein WBV10_03140 [Exiguobacterium marinum]|uniref:hypothetical protein n=1 Tax=Exiguobacterium marinum TaxID=273528 RepID=UPI003C5A068E
MLFEKNKVYRRSSIHDQYGGNRQRGISPSAKHDIIFIFDMKHSSFDYANRWDEKEGLYYYNGEGQVGDQTFTSGNKALLRHIESNKDVYLFEEIGNSMYRFVDQMILIGYDIQFGSDKNYQQREIIVFTFEPIHSVFEGARHFFENMKYKTLDELHLIAQQNLQKVNGLSTTTRKQQIREQSAAVYYSIFARANNHCEACGSQSPFETEDGPYLELHSLHSDSDQIILRPGLGAAVCPNCHMRLHKGKDRSQYNKQLELKIIAKLIENIDRP